VTTEIQTQLQGEQTQVDLALATISAMPVQDQATLTTVNEWLVQGKDRAKAIEEQRVSITKPQNEALRATNALFRPVLDQYQKLIGVLGRKVVEGTQYLEAERTRALQAAAELYRAENPVAHQQANQMMTALPEDPSHKGTSVRKIWKFEITSAPDVPRAYCCPDDKAIRAHVAAGARDIPGVRIWEESVAWGTK
jgi:hypothetical protein